MGEILIWVGAIAAAIAALIGLIMLVIRLAILRPIDMRVEEHLNPMYQKTRELEKRTDWLNEEVKKTQAQAENNRKILEEIKADVKVIGSHTSRKSGSFGRRGLLRGLNELLSIYASRIF